MNAEPILDPEDELLEAGPGENESEAGRTFDQDAYLERLHLIDLDGRPSRWPRLSLSSYVGMAAELPEIADLFYAGRRHLVSGPGEALKTWLCLAAAVAEIKADRGIIWADLDGMGPRDITARLLALGASEEEIEHYVFFTNPEGQLDAPEICELLAWASETRCRLLVADAFTGFLVQHDLDGNLGKDVEKAWQRLDRFLAAGIAGRKYDQRHSVERRARNSARWQRARAEARKRDGEQCQQCGSSERLQVHHIVPLSQGGDRYALSNLVTLCQECHARAGGGRAS